MIVCPNFTKSTMKNKAFDKVLDIVRSYLHEQPTNNVGGGQIAGTKEAGDDPPVPKKEKEIYLHEGCQKDVET